MTEYKPNSHKYRNAQKKKEIKQVTTGKVQVKKKSTTSKFLEEMLPGNRNSIKEYVVKDVLLPTFKKIISDSVDILLYDNVKHSKSSRGDGGYVSYRDYGSRNSSSRRRTPRDVDDVIFESRAEAEDVLNAMDDILDEYEFVSVSDYYELAGVGTGSHTNNRYGWSNLRSAEVVRIREGYTIKMPRPKVID